MRVMTEQIGLDQHIRHSGSFLGIEPRAFHNRGANRRRSWWS